MYQYDDFLELVIDNLKRIVFPEEWLTLDVEMSKQELFTIMIVDRLGEATMSQISEQMNFPMSTATGIVDRLVKKGYIERSRSEADRRVVAIVLSEEGKAFMQYVRRNISEYIRIAYDALNDDERNYIFKILNKIVTAIQQHRMDTTKEKNEKKIVRKIKIE